MQWRDVIEQWDATERCDGGMQWSYGNEQWDGAM